MIDEKREIVGGKLYVRRDSGGLIIALKELD